MSPLSLEALFQSGCDGHHLRVFTELGEVDVLNLCARDSSASSHLALSFQATSKTVIFTDGDQTDKLRDIE